MIRLMATLLAFLTSVAYAAQEGEVAAAAKVQYPAATWQERSVLSGDFSCHGKAELAILGTSPKFIVVAIFTNGLSSKPVFLEYSAKARKAKTAALTKESRDFKPGEAGGDSGEVPEGYTPSKTCVGLNLSDGDTDSAHIYWDTTYKQFLDWTL